MLNKKLNKIWKSHKETSCIRAAVKDGRCYIVNDYMAVTFPALPSLWAEYAAPGLLCDMPEDGQGFKWERGEKNADPELSAVNIWKNNTQGTGHARGTPFSADIARRGRSKLSTLRLFVAENKPVFLDSALVDAVDWRQAAEIRHLVGRGSVSPLTFWSDAEHEWEGALILPVRPTDPLLSALAETVAAFGR